MGLFDKLLGELIDIVEWLDDSRDVMVYRFPRFQNEIKMGAKLVVRESQCAVFINEGKLADVFPPGTYTLETRNLPILTTLKGWRYGFDSPFKAEIYFVNTRRFVDLKWGTANPVIVRDAEFGPVRLRSYGTYCIRVTDPKRFMTEIVGTDAIFQTAEIVDQLRNMIVARFSDLLGESKVPLLDLAASYDELGRFCSEKLHDEVGEYGLDLDTFLVENISLPPDVEAALDKRSEMGLVGDLSRFTQYQAATAMEAAARNPGGGGGEGLGMGLGIAMGQKMADALSFAGTPAHGGTVTAPPPFPAAFYLGVEGQRIGPLDVEGVRREVSVRGLSAETLVWRAGMESWRPARDVGELAGVFPPPEPPPLPEA